MDIWYSQMDTDNVKTSIRIDKQLFSEHSDYQRIDVFQSKEFGKMIALDGEIIFSEADEFIYNEMVVHVPMAVHKHVKDVLIIGGGGAFKEVLVEGGISKYVSTLFSGTSISPILAAWLITALLRVSLGSSTVSSMTAAGLIAPMTAHMSPTMSALMVLSIGAGSVFCDLDDQGILRPVT